MISGRVPTNVTTFIKLPLSLPAVPLMRGGPLVSPAMIARMKGSLSSNRFISSTSSRSVLCE